MKLEAAPRGPPFTPTAPNLFKFARDTHGEREFLVLDGQRLSYAEVERRSVTLAKGLLALGVGKGSRVGILMPNNPEWVVTWMACSRIGALSVLLSTFYQASEIAWSVRHNDIQVLLTVSRYLTGDYLERLERGLPGLATQTSPDIILLQAPYLRRIVVWGDCDRPWALRGPSDIIAAGAAEPRINDALLETVETSIRPADPLLTICTSGTTSEPKAVVHCHGAALRLPYQFLDYCDVRPEDRMYPAMPFFWVGGLNTHLIPAMYMGSCICFTLTPDPIEIIDTAKREAVTLIIQWPPQTNRLLQALKQTGQTLPLVRVGLGPQVDLRGQTIPVDRQVGGGLGMTEAFGWHSLDRMDIPAPLGKAGSNGRKIAGMQRIIVDPNSGRPLACSQRGELQIRGENMMLGYYGKERWEVFTRDDFFPTGDLAFIDEEGFLFYLGRDGEMIKTSGANVAPQEVENALSACQGVREAIVFGLPDEVKGEVVVAVVSAAPGSALSAEALRHALRETISPYKVPQTIALVAHDEIPRTASGKPIKHKLREMLFPLASE